MGQIRILVKIRDTEISWERKDVTSDFLRILRLSYVR